jgi:predicted RNA-binding protein Jag
MNKEQARGEIQSFLEKLLESLGLIGDIRFEDITENRTKISIQVEADQQYLIGKHGMALDSVQQIVSSIARKNKSEVQYRVDVNNYKEEKKTTLVIRVRDYIEEKVDDKSVLLWPMSSYERRVIHEYFLGEGTHITESEDFGTERVVRVTKK